MRLNINDSFHGINCHYARRREFHRPFWDALRAQLHRWTSSAATTEKPITTSL